MNLKDAERILIPKGRSMGRVLQYLEMNNVKSPTPLNDSRRCLHFSC